jgi:hypothetical protein
LSPLLPFFPPPLLPSLLSPPFPPSPSQIPRDQTRNPPVHHVEQQSRKPRPVHHDLGRAHGARAPRGPELR